MFTSKKLKDAIEMNSTGHIDNSAGHGVSLIDIVATMIMFNTEDEPQLKWFRCSCPYRIYDVT